MPVWSDLSEKQRVLIVEALRNETITPSSMDWRSLKALQHRDILKRVLKGFQLSEFALFDLDDRTPRAPREFVMIYRAFRTIHVKRLEQARANIHAGLLEDGTDPATGEVRQAPVHPEQISMFDKE